MALFRSSQTGYEPFGVENREYIAYKFITRITLCCLGFALCMIVLLYVSAYCCTETSERQSMPYSSNLEANRNKKMPKNMKEKVESVSKGGYASDKSLCLVETDAHRFDCFPEGNANEKSCNARGCCWDMKPSPVPSPVGVPSCYYPKSYGGYNYFNVTYSANGVRAFLKRIFPSPYPNDVKLLRLDAQYQSSTILHVKIIDPFNQRYEPLYPEVPIGLGNPPRKPTYQFILGQSGFQVKRRNNDIVFDAIDKGAFIFSDQLLQISAVFQGKIYGIGEHQSNFQLSTNWSRFTLFNHDSVPLEYMNLYGSHPFYMILEPTGKSHGVLFLNSSPMDIILQPLPAVTFRTIGGVFDFFFLMGPTPDDVLRQYTEIVGRPFMPPYWSLGFHLSRLGFDNVEQMRTVWLRTRNAKIPFDTQWNDIDYMQDNNDFTYDKKRYKDLPEFVKELHDVGMHYIPIIDPGISGCEKNGTYPPYDEGIDQDVFVKSADGSVFVGKVWNHKCTVFPDFTNPKTLIYWTKLIGRYHASIPFDGIWLDMNEPSNFINGSITGCPQNNIEHPIYLPAVDGKELSYKTLCMSAKHYAGLHYNVHNIYGLGEAILTKRALEEVTGKRSFVISRSTFPGLGKYAGHWSGDVASTWYDMKKSISQMLSFTIYGIPMMGSDICGFNGNTTTTLCQRWSQLGAFYPFSRNHNTDDAIDQDPVALGPEIVESTKTALEIRYTLLPYLYTLFWKAHKFGDAVVKPLLFEFWDDNNTHTLDKSFLWGCCILIVPVLEENATTVKTYLPEGRWYDWYTGLGKESSGAEITLAAPYEQIPILIRGGVILPSQIPNVTTALSRKNDLVLLAAFNSSLCGSGMLYWDDGESLYNEHYNNYGLVEFTLTKMNLTSNVVNWGTKEVLVLGSVKIYGFILSIKNLFLNGKATKFIWNSTTSVLIVKNLSHYIYEPFILSWS